MTKEEVLDKLNKEMEGSLHIHQLQITEYELVIVDWREYGLAIPAFGGGEGAREYERSECLEVFVFCEDELIEHWEGAGYGKLSIEERGITVEGFP